MFAAFVLDGGTTNPNTESINGSRALFKISQFGNSLGDDKKLFTYSQGQH